MSPPLWWLKRLKRLMLPHIYENHVTIKRHILSNNIRSNFWLCDRANDGPFANDNVISSRVRKVFKECARWREHINEHLHVIHSIQVM